VKKLSDVNKIGIHDFDTLLSDSEGSYLQKNLRSFCGTSSG